MGRQPERSATGLQGEPEPRRTPDDATDSHDLDALGIGVTSARSRYFAALIAICLGVTVVSASAGEPAFVLLPDKSLVSPDPDAEGELTKTGRDWVGLGRDT